MRKLILATVSVLALGLAASGGGYAAEPGNGAQLPGPNTPSADMPSATTPPSAGMTRPETQSTAPVHLSRTHLRQVQEQLKTAGLYKGEIDGIMGPQTRRAIAQFQEKNGLQGTGKLDRQTLAALGNTGANRGTSGVGSSMTSGNQPSDAGGLNGPGNPNMPSGWNRNPPGASGNLNPSTNPNRH
jgi:peptidoglycan hydrolase-like protein with peptidoglycan-binding domain